MYHWVVNLDVVRVRLPESLQRKNRGYNGEITTSVVYCFNEVNETNLMQRVVLVRYNSLSVQRRKAVEKSEDGKTGRNERRDGSCSSES